MFNNRNSWLVIYDITQYYLEIIYYTLSLISHSITRKLPAEWPYFLGYALPWCSANVLDNADSGNNHIPDPCQVITDTRSPLSYQKGHFFHKNKLVASQFASFFCLDVQLQYSKGGRKNVFEIIFFNVLPKDPHETYRNCGGSGFLKNYLDPQKGRR